MFLRTVIETIFDECDFFRSRFLFSFRESYTNQPVVVNIDCSLTRGLVVYRVDWLSEKYVRQTIEFCF